MAKRTIRGLSRQTFAKPQPEIDYSRVFPTGKGEEAAYILIHLYDVALREFGSDAIILITRLWRLTYGCDTHEHCIVTWDDFFSEESGAAPLRKNGKAMQDLFEKLTHEGFILIRKDEDGKYWFRLPTFYEFNVYRYGGK